MSVVELVPAIPRATTESSLELAVPAYQLAERIASTEFVPSALRNKPDAILAAILTGHELGLAPMISLSKIHVIEGRPAMSAELMRALVLSAGHDVWVAESTTTKCTVGAKRRDSKRESTFTWTVDDAKRAGLDGRPNWRKFPRAMLLARATAEAVRAVFPDVIAGLSYSTEELEDGFEFEEAGEGAAASGDGSTKRKAKAKRAATAAPASSPAPAAIAAAADDFPPLPDEPLEVGGGGGDFAADTTTDHPSPPPDDQADDQGGALPLSSRVALWCKDAAEALHGELSVAEHKAWRQAFLTAWSGGTVTSATEVQPSMIDQILATLQRLNDGVLVLDDPHGNPVLRTTATGLPTTDPAGEHQRLPGTGEDLSKLTVAQLAERLRALGLSPSGAKADLIAQLEGATS